MTQFSSGDSLSPATLNRKLASAASVGGFSTQTLNVETAVDSEWTIAAQVHMLPIHNGEADLDTRLGSSGITTFNPHALSLAGGSDDVATYGAVIKLLGSDCTQANSTPSIGGSIGMFTGTQTGATLNVYSGPAAGEIFSASSSSIAVSVPLSLVSTTVFPSAASGRGYLYVASNSSLYYVNGSGVSSLIK